MRSPNEDYCRRSLTTAASLAAMPAHATNEGAPGKDVMERAAAGVLSVAGGARRTAGDNSEAYRTLLGTSTARNVILLIGDGMGDSEITLARNYAQGAGGYFKGLDALPISGHLSHYSLDREPASRTM